jgi:hypothetical protein
MKALTSILYLLSAICCLAQPQQAWVARYNGGFTNKTNTPLAMKLDSAGNIYVAGSSQNASNFYDYVVLKYSPNGALQWAARYSPTNGGTYPANGFALDQNGNTYMTGGISGQDRFYVMGNGATVKFDTNGQVAWAAPYNGSDIAVDTNGNVYVTGFSATQYATAKLNSQGNNVWTRTYVYVTSPGNPVAVSQKVAVDNAGNAYVAGWLDFVPYYMNGQWNYYAAAAVLRYDGNGAVLWTNGPYASEYNWGKIVGLLPDNHGNFYVAGNSSDFSYLIANINTLGQTIWGQKPFGSSSPGVTAIATDANNQVYLTGDSFLNVKVAGTNGQVLWWKYQTSGQANSIAVNSTNGFCVTGFTNSGASGNDWETVKYDTNGDQQWVIRYNGPANGNDGAAAIAVAPDGSIYVTGYSQNSSGGSDITTIKYGSITNIQKKSDGSIQLQFFGTPGQSYNFQATTNFMSWNALGSSLADTNGIFEYLDTNALLFPYRFYRWSPP